MALLAAAGLALGACSDGTDDVAESVPVTDGGADPEPAPTTPLTTAPASTAGAPTTDAQPLETSTTTVTTTPSEIVITEPGLYPEGLTYDPVNDRFIVGSLLGGQLLAVSDDGSTNAVAESPGSNLTGIEADVSGNRLLVAVTGLPFGTAQLSVHDLTTGEQLELVDFASVQPDDRRFANGIAVDDDGNIYVTDTGAGVIYAVDSSYRPSVFAQDASFEPDRSGTTASGLNGIVAVGDALIVGHAPTGQIFRVPLSDPSQVTVVPTGVDGMRIDGLHLSEDGSTLAVVSNFGTVHLFESVDNWLSMSEMASFDVGDSFPTSVTDRNGTFFVLLSHLNEIGNPAVEAFEIVSLIAESAG
jgi:sugar lactone lactonase YvrE